MASFEIVVMDVLGDCSTSLPDVVPFCQIRFLIFEGAEPAFNFNVVCPTIMVLNDACSAPYMVMQGYGSYVYFILSDSVAFGEVYRYNTESDIVEKMNIGTIAAEDFTVKDGNIYYKKEYDSKQIYCYHPMEDKEELFADLSEISADFLGIIRDSENFYMYYTQDGQEKVAVINEQGVYQKDIVLKETSDNQIPISKIGGDTDYFLYKVTQVVKEDKANTNEYQLKYEKK